MKCYKCGNEIPDDIDVCAACGEPAMQEMPPQEKAEQAVIDATASSVDQEELAPQGEDEQEEATAPEADSIFTEEARETTVGYQPEEQKEYRSAVAGYQEKMNKLVRPVRTSGFFFTELLLLIPVINLILLFVWAFRKRTNLNRKAFARSILIWILLVLLLVLAGLVTMLVLQMPTDYHYWISWFKDLVNSIPG